MPRGGYRQGAGRKPVGGGVVLGLDGKRQRARYRGVELPPAVAGEDRERLVVPPKGIGKASAAFWRLWAPRAVEERTLTPSTAVGFVETCQRAAYVAALAKRIEHLGPATKEAVPYLMLYDKMAQKLEGSLSRFKLTAMGKPATSDKPKAAANPWEQLAAK